MKAKQEKTNVMRILDQKHIPYTPRTYPHGDEAVDGAEVARLMGQDPAAVFKTLVAQGASRSYYVFDIPVCAELDLKKAAKAVGEKSIVMLHVKDLLPLTGYVRGGCSPIGMKKQFFTTFHSSARQLDQVAVSGGRIGTQVVIDPRDIVTLLRGQFADIIKD